MKNRLNILIIAVTVIFQHNKVWAQADGKILPMDYVNCFYSNGSDNVKPFYYGADYVTNKEYVIYLTWLESIYVDYPLNFWQAIPGYTSNNIPLQYPENRMKPEYKKIIDSVLNILPAYVNKYIFNPKYQDWPVLGITYKQALNYLEWMTNRYNETQMIYAKYMLFDPNQLNEENFVLESYLNGQYEGLVNKLYFYKKHNEYGKVSWYSNVLRPSFRLPSYAEIKLIKPPDNKTKKLKKDWSVMFWDEYVDKRYDYEERHRYPVMNYYLNNFENTEPDISKDIYFWIIDKQVSSKYTNQPVLKTLQINGQEQMSFDSLNKTKYLGLEINYIFKDSLGKMPYFLLGSDEAGKPVYSKRDIVKGNVPGKRMICNLSKSIKEADPNKSYENVGIFYNISAIKEMTLEKILQEF